MRISDWSSDVCSSDLCAGRPGIRDERAGALVAAVPGDPVGAGGALFQRRIPRRAARRTRCRCAARAAVRQADTDDGGQAVTNASITAADLFEQMRERLDLHWIGGQQGESRVLEAVDTVARRPSLAGYLNTIYPNKVQILGTEELSWLDSLDSRQRWELIERLIRYRPLALVLSKDQSCPVDQVEAAEESGTQPWGRSEGHTA